MATQTRGRGSSPQDGSGRGKGSRTTPQVFVRQVVAEMRKVIWPTRRELITYTTVALVFVLIMVGIVSALDYGFTKGVLALFG
jgi:preprotein translocase subunit SecE